MEEIRENDFNLNISRYIDTSEPEPEVDLQLVQKKLNDLEKKEALIDEQLATFLNELGV